MIHRTFRQRKAPSSTLRSGLAPTAALLQATTLFLPIVVGLQPVILSTSPELHSSKFLLYSGNKYYPLRVLGHQRQRHARSSLEAPSNPNQPSIAKKNLHSLWVLPPENSSENFHGGNSSPGGRDDNSPANESNNNDKSRKFSVARVGRRRSNLNSLYDSKKEVSDKGIFASLGRWFFPIILAFLLMRSLFSGIFGVASNPSVVYYSKSVYEVTTYGNNGNMETKRKESFQSNIPGLLEKASKNQESGYGRGATYDLDSAIDDEIDELEDEIDSWMFRRW